MWKRFWLTLSMVLQKREYTAHPFRILFISWQKVYSTGLSLSLSLSLSLWYTHACAYTNSSPPTCSYTHMPTHLHAVRSTYTYTCMMCMLTLVSRHRCMHAPTYLHLSTYWFFYGAMFLDWFLIFFFHAFRFLDISSVQLKMPNIHFLPVNLKNKDNETIVKVWLFFTSDVCRSCGKNTKVDNIWHRLYSNYRLQFGFEDLKSRDVNNNC